MTANESEPVHTGWPAQGQEEPHRWRACECLPTLREGALLRWLRGCGVALGLMSLLLPGRSVEAQSVALAGAGSRDTTVSIAHSALRTLLHSLLDEREVRRFDSLRVPFADVEHLAGGLQAIQAMEGDGFRQLRVQAANGNHYVARARSENPLEEFLSSRGDPLQWAMQGQVVAAMAEAIGLPSVVPSLYVMPDSPRLGVHRQAFAGRLVCFERYPATDSLAAAGSSEAERALTSRQLLDRLGFDPAATVDAEAFLKARLLDLLVGDDERGTEGWLWVRRSTQEADRWVPLPIDRDGAFMGLNGGLGVSWEVLGSSTASTVWFEPSFGNDVTLTGKAYDLDRLFLSRLDKAAFQAAVEEVRKRLSRPALRAAVAPLSPFVTPAGEQALVQLIETRKQALPAQAAALYRLVATYADVVLTDGGEVATLERLPGGDVAVQVVRQNGATPEGGGPVTYQRVFRERETQEIRLFTRGGDDRVHVGGAGPARITIRIATASGRDDVVDETEAQGKNIYVYGKRPSLSVTGGPGLRVNSRTPMRYIRGPGEGEGIGVPDWGTNQAVAIAIGYSVDLGWHGGVGVRFDQRQYLEVPFKRQVRATLAYALNPGALVGEVLLYNRSIRPNLHGAIGVRGGGGFIPFYGFGNETSKARASDFYHIVTREFRVQTSLVFAHIDWLRIEVGPQISYVRSDTTLERPNILGVIRPYGSDGFWRGGLQASLRTEQLDHPDVPMQGYQVDVGGRWVPGLLDVKRGGYGSVDVAVKAYARVLPFRNHSAAVRMGGKKAFGTFPFMEAAFLGGASTLRGFNEGRFAGAASVYGGVEYRMPVLGTVLMSIPTRLGLLVFSDAGRVFQEGEASRTLHWAVGAGIWAAPGAEHLGFDRLRFRVELARSVEQVSVYFGTGYQF